MEEQRIHDLELGENPLGHWSDLKPSFRRQVGALMKKQFVIKWRHAASIIEFALGLVIYLVIYPIDLLARTKYAEDPNPEINTTIPLTKLMAFYAMFEGPTVVARPNSQRMKDLLAHMPVLGQLLTGKFWTINQTTFELEDMDVPKPEVQYVNDQKELEEAIYARDSNGLGIVWVNCDKEDAFTNPMFEIYQQVDIGPTPENDIYWDVKQGLAALRGPNKDGTTDYPPIDWKAVMPDVYNAMMAGMAKPPNIPEMMNALMSYYAKIGISFPDTGLMHYPGPGLQFTLKTGAFAKPKSEEKFDISIATSLFCILPIILATMPDLQTVLEEKDSKVAPLGFLMGCSETAYWFVSFITPFILSLLPYIGFSLCLCYWFGMVGTSFSLVLVMSILFVIAHIWFQLWIVTFMKKGSSGRILTIVMIVFAMFFGYLHAFLTLDEDNSSEALKHIFAIIPFSAYQEFLMSAYSRCSARLDPFQWSDLNADVVMPPWIPLMWLVIDCILYFVLFVIFNATNERAFGTPIIRWREIFNKDAWKRIFHKGGSLKIAPKTDMFMEVEQLRKVFEGEGKDVVALDEVNFHIKTGEVIVMIGPNGAGKSTLMNVIAGAVEPTMGKLRLLNGKETDRFREIQSYLGVCFQDNVIINLLSVREHFELFGAFRGVPPEVVEQAIDFFAATLQLTEMLDNRAGDLSGGQKRKLCIGLSLLGNPPIVIMDEPTAGVDVQARQLIWKMISSLKETTTIVTSHALEEAEAVSSRLFIMSNGKIPFCGTSTELRNQFKCGYVLRVEREGDLQPVLELVQSFIPDARPDDERPDMISMPVDGAIPGLLKALEARKEELKIISYSFAVEQLEDMLLKLIQSDEANIQNH